MKKSAFGFLAVLLCLLTALVLAEIILRCKGEKPGYKWQLDWNDNPDAITIDTFWKVDSVGINKISQAANSLIEKALRKDSISAFQNPVLSYLVLSHGKIITPTDSNPPVEDESFEKHFTHYCPSPFLDMVNDFEGGRKPIEDSVDLAYINFMKNPVNDDGFYSIPFKNFQTKKKKILVVGDSYTLGFSSIPSYNNFACLLAAKGYAVFNAGMPGSEPAQYAAIVRTYIQRIKPDFVFIEFQSGGDRMVRDRPLKPHTGFTHFIINGQFVRAFFNGQYFSNPNEAYQFYNSKNLIPTDNLYSLLASKTVVGSRVWVKYHERSGSINMSKSMGEEPQYWADSLSFSEKYMLEMDSICHANGAVPVIILFPECNDMEMTFLRNPPYVFRKISYKIIQGLTIDDLYCHDDNHFNNEGHRKVAEYIHQLISTTK